MTIELSSFPTMWSWLVQHFLLFFQWTDQITIGGLSLLKIGIGLTVITIVFAVVLPIIRTAPISAGLGSGGMTGDTAPSGPDRNSYEYYAERRSRLEDYRSRYDKEKFD